MKDEKRKMKGQGRHKLGIVRLLASYRFFIFHFSFFILGCQGQPFSKPPIHIVPDMDHQPKYKAQGAAMRTAPAGTIARGALHDGDPIYTGREPGSDQPLAESPVAVTMEGLKRGQERFNIYCAVCHSRVGDGKGIMLQRGYVPPPSFHTEIIRNYPDGHIFNVITNGLRNMPAYGAQIPARDRWLIVNYLRVLERSQNAAAADVPTDIRVSK